MAIVFDWRRIDRAKIVVKTASTSALRQMAEDSASAQMAWMISASVIELSARGADDRVRGLLDEARQRVTRLRNTACDLARRVPADGDGPDAQEWRARVRGLLGWVGHLLPVLFLTIILTATPAEVEASLASWYHEATRVVAICLVADYAPSAVIARQNCHRQNWSRRPRWISSCKRFGGNPIRIGPEYGNSSSRQCAASQAGTCFL